MLNRLTLRESTSLEEALELLDANGNGILPVIDNGGKLVGILTDGDLRRGLLKKKNTIHDLINWNPTVAFDHEPRAAIIQRLHVLRRRHMPVVKADGTFVDVVVLNDFNQRILTNKVVIMAGGLGSRLGEITKDTPKPMLQIKGKPLLERIIDNFKEKGFVNFVLCLNYKFEVIQNYFDDGKEFGVSIEYTIEEKRLGTAGALSLIDEDKLVDPFIVTNGDVLTSLAYDELLDTHIKSDVLATMCIKRHAIQLPYANVVFDDYGNIISLEEKPSVSFHVNAGIYALSPPALRRIPRNEYYDMPMLFEELVKEKRKVKTFVLDDYWIDIGHPNDFKIANE